MGLVEDKLLKTEAKRESYLPVHEVVDIVNSNENHDMDLVTDVMDSLGIFSLTAYAQTSLDLYNPVYEPIGTNYELKQKLKDLKISEQRFFENSNDYVEYQEIGRYVAKHLWSRLDLLKIEKLVEHTGLVSWGEHDALCFMYNEMVNSKDSGYHKLPKISKQAIDDYLSLGIYQRKLINRASYSPEEIICLMTNEDPDSISHDDKYIVYWDIINSAFSSNELTPSHDSQDVEADQVKKWLKNKGLFYQKPNSDLPLTQSVQVNELQKRIDELEKELNVFKEGSNDLREVIKVNFTDDEYRDIVELANQDGVSESEYISNAVIKAIDTICPFIKAFDLNDDENLSKARSKFLNYLKENNNSFEVFSMLADAEIFPREHSHFSSSQELNIKDSAYCLPADDNIEQDHLYNWQAMDKNQYPPELHLAIEIWKEYYHPDAIKHISQFDAGRFNRIANDFNLSKGNLKDRVRTLLTPLNSKTRSPELLSSLEVINIIHNDKLEQD